MVLKVAGMSGAGWLARMCALWMRRSNQVDVSQWSGLTALVGRVSNFDAGEDRQYLMLARER